MLQWLVDEHCCPLRSIRISNGKQRDNSGSYTPILTSRGRSLLGIALNNRNIGIVRYLVVEKRMLLAAEKGLSVDTLVQNLDLVLRILPEAAIGEQALGQSDSRNYSTSCESSSGRPSSTSTMGIPESTRMDEQGQASHHMHREDDDGSISSVSDEVRNDWFDKSRQATLISPDIPWQCIICCANKINCVATPCGHQMCCLDCGNHIQRCPVCSQQCQFMRVYKP